MMYSRNKTGFTLAEMVVVLAVMSILMTMSVAAYTSMLQSKGVEGALKTIKGALSTARMKAMRDRREVTCGLTIDGAIDSGFVVVWESAPKSTMTKVIKRMRRCRETDADIGANVSLRKDWADSTFRDYWAYIVGGIGAGHKPVKIITNYGWQLHVQGWEEYPENNSLICILEGTKGEPAPDTTGMPYMISSDMVAGAWEMLPGSVDVHGKYFPITFSADGTAAFPYDHAIIMICDRRTDPQWTWRIVVSRSGRVTTSMIQPDDEEGDFDN